jgi:hypothetical protein
VSAALARGQSGGKSAHIPPFFLKDQNLAYIIYQNFNFVKTSYKGILSELAQILYHEWYV